MRQTRDAHWFGTRVPATTVGTKATDVLKELGVTMTDDRRTDSVTEAQGRMTRVHQQYAPALRDYLNGFARASRQSAEDLLQETMIRVWRHIEDLPAEPEHTRRWLFTVARNAGIDAVRRARARPVGVQWPDLNRLPATEDVTGTVVALDSLRTAIGALSLLHRRILTELYVEGYSVAEVAHRLGVPVGTVKSRAFYAVRSVRTAMNGS